MFNSRLALKQINNFFDKLVEIHRDIEIDRRNIIQENKLEINETEIYKKKEYRKSKETFYKFIRLQGIESSLFEACLN